MSLSLINKGIQHRDWELVETGYKMLAGEAVRAEAPDVEPEPYHYEDEYEGDYQEEQQAPVEPVQPSPEPPARKRDQYDFTFQNIPQNHKKKDSDGRTEARSEPINLKKVGAFNLFEDDKTHKPELLQEEIAKRSKGKSMYVSQAERGVRGNNLVQIECEGCHRTFEVAKIHTIRAGHGSTYKCPKCVTSITPRM